jgi:hypothetical protein
MYDFTPFKDLKLYGASIDSILHIGISVMLLLLIVEIKNYDVGVAFNCIKFIPSFVDISQMIPMESKLKRRNRYVS